MLRFQCTQCRTQLEAPPGSEGSKCDCPTCGTRLLIPGTSPSPSPRMPDLEIDSDSIKKERKSSQQPTSREPAYREYEWDEEREEREERRRRRSQSNDEEEDLRSRSSRGFRCPFCRTPERPRTEQRISTAGWVVFAVLLFACLPLFWIGLLIREDVQLCRDCGMRLGG